MQPHRWQPTRLLHPWDSPGKNTEVGCHFLLQYMKMKVKSVSCVQLLATPWTAAHQAPPSLAFSRQEYWSGVPLPSPQTCMVTLILNSVQHSGIKVQEKHLCNSLNFMWNEIWPISDLFQSFLDFSELRLVHCIFFPMLFYEKFHTYTEVERLCYKYSWPCPLEAAVSILLYLFYHMFIPSNDPSIFEAFQR